MEVKSIQDVADLVAKKMNEVSTQVDGLKKELEASEQKQKDIFKLDEAKEAIKSQISDLMSIKDGEKSTQIGDFCKNMQTQLNSIESQIKEQGLSGKNKVKSVAQQVKEFLQGGEYKKFADARKAGIKNVETQFDVKALVTTDIDAVGTDSVALSLATLEAGVNKAPNNPTLFYDLIQKGTISGKDIVWIERNTVTRNAAATGENAVFLESSLNWVEKKASAVKIADSAVVSNEMLEDYDYAMSEVMELLQFNIPNIRDSYIYSGTGLNSQLLGITATDVAKTFAVPTGVEAIQNPDSVDVLATAVLQVMLGNSATDTASIGFAPTAIVINPIDLHNLKLIRDGEGRFKYPELWMPTPTVAGVPLRVSTRMAVGSYLVGDFSYAKYFAARGLNIRMWDQNGTDAVYDRVTFTASERGVLRIKSHDKFAFVKGTFAAGKTALENIA